MTATSSAFACSCLSDKEILVYSLADKIGINPESITIHTVKETSHPVFNVGNQILLGISNSEEMECRISCSLRGVRLVAHISYKKNGKICAARLLKRARTNAEVVLERVVCN